MKRFLALLLALMMTLSLVACGSAPSGTDGEGAGDAQNSDGGEKVELYREERESSSNGVTASGAYAIYYPNGEGQRPTIEVYRYHEYEDESRNIELLDYQYTPTYDDQGNLVTETLIRRGNDEGGNSSQTYVETNTYNPDGSYTRTVVKEATGELRETYTFDSAGRMTSWEHLSGAWYECSYDEQGHTASERAFSVDDVWPGESRTDYTYDSLSNTSPGIYYCNFVGSNGNMYSVDEDVTIFYDDAVRVTEKTGEILSEGYLLYSEDGKLLPPRPSNWGNSVSYFYDASSIIVIETTKYSSNSGGVYTENIIFLFDATNNIFDLLTEGNHRGVISLSILANIY